MDTKMSEEQRERSATRAEAAKKICAVNAILSWGWYDFANPYGDQPLYPEHECVGRGFFAQSPDFDVWVWGHDLPRQTFDEISKRINLYGTLEEFAGAQAAAR